MRTASLISDDPVAGMRNLHLLLARYCLRRKQSILQQVVENKTEIVRIIKFTNHERQNYEKIKRDCHNTVQDQPCHVRQQSYGSDFQTIMKQRLFCNLGPMSCTSGANLDDPWRCSYCGGWSDLQEPKPVANKYEAGCGILLCVSSCPGRVMQMRPQEFRPTRQAGELSFSSSSGSTLLELREEGSWDVRKSAQTMKIGGKRYPSKIIYLMKDILNNPQNEKRLVHVNIKVDLSEDTDASNTSIVFSSWVRSLELARSALYSSGVGCRLIDGRLKIDERKRVLETFCKEPQVMVLLMTTGTGAAGYDSLS